MIRISSKFRIYARYYSSESKVKTVKLATASYTGSGNNQCNKALLITHGLLGSKQNWNSLSKNLQSKFKEVYAFDLRNHGESPHASEMTIEIMAEDVKQLIADCHVTNPILLGHSLGGKVAMHLALKEPGLISGLVAVDIAPVDTFNITVFSHYIDAMIRAPIDKSVSLQMNRKNVDDYLSVSIKVPSIRNFLLMNLVSDPVDGHVKWRANLQSMLENVRRFFEFPIPPGGVFEKPVLFIKGARSDYIKQEDWPVIKEMFPFASLSTVQGAGHWVHSEKPQEFLSILNQFISDHKFG